MTKRFIDIGIFRETLRRLRVPALVMLILVVVIEGFPYLMDILLYNPYDTFGDFYELHPAQYIIPFVAPFLLTLIAFRFQTSRTDSDFYHALPFTRTTLSLSMLSAVATWCAIISVVSAAVMGLFSLSYSCTFTALDVIRDTAASFTATLLMLSVTFLTVTMCGNTVSVVFAVGILLFAPFLIASSLVSTLVNMTPVLSYFDSFEFFIRYNLLYGNYDAWDAWLVTGLGAALCFGLAFWMNKRRPSETAGNATAHPALQIALRSLLALVCCLPAIGSILNESFTNDLGAVLFLYMLALVAYFLYELLTTKKVKNLLKAIPWLGVLAALNVLCIAAVLFFQHFALSYTPDAATVDAVSLTHIEYFDTIPHYNTDTDDLATDKPILPTDYSNFHSYSDRYDKSDCPDVKLTDDTSKAIICERLKTACETATKQGYLSEYAKTIGGRKEWCCYDVEVAIHVNGITHTRVIWLYDSELVHLFTAIEEQAHVPLLYDNRDKVTYPIFKKE